MRLLYLGGKKWKSDTMIASVLTKNNTKELLEYRGVIVDILEYTNEDTHESITNRAIEKSSNNDFIFGYSYGAEVASACCNENTKGIIMLDLLSHVPPNLINEYFERDYRNANPSLNNPYNYSKYSEIPCPVLSVITKDGRKNSVLDTVKNICYSYFPNSTHLVMVEEGRYQLVDVIMTFMEKYCDKKLVACKRHI